MSPSNDASHVYGTLLTYPTYCVQCFAHFFERMAIRITKTFNRRTTQSCAHFMGHVDSTKQFSNRNPHRPKLQYTARLGARSPRISPCRTFPFEFCAEFVSCIGSWSPCMLLHLPKSYTCERGYIRSCNRGI